MWRLLKNKRVLSSLKVVYYLIYSFILGLVIFMVTHYSSEGYDQLCESQVGNTTSLLLAKATVMTTSSWKCRFYWHPIHSEIFTKHKFLDHLEGFVVFNYLEIKQLGLSATAESTLKRQLHYIISYVTEPAFLSKDAESYAKWLNTRTAECVNWRKCLMLL